MSKEDIVDTTSNGHLRALVVGGEPRRLDTLYGKLAKHGLDVVWRWPWNAGVGRRLPSDAQVVVLLTDLMSHDESDYLVREARLRGLKIVWGNRHFGAMAKALATAGLQEVKTMGTMYEDHRKVGTTVLSKEAIAKLAEASGAPRTVLIRREIPAGANGVAQQPPAAVALPAPAAPLAPAAVVAPMMCVRRQGIGFGDPAAQARAHDKMRDGKLERWRRIEESTRRFLADVPDNVVISSGTLLDLVRASQPGNEQRCADSALRAFLGAAGFRVSPNIGWCRGEVARDSDGRVLAWDFAARRVAAVGLVEKRVHRKVMHTLMAHTTVAVPSAPPIVSAPSPVPTPPPAPVRAAAPSPVMDIFTAAGLLREAINASKGAVQRVVVTGEKFDIEGA